MNYRDLLYANYSANFGEHKRYDPQSQYGVYEPTYRRFLPADTGMPIADVGCGKGEWLHWLRHLGYQNLTGIDVAASELKNVEGTESVVTIDGIGTEVLRNQQDGSFGLIHAKDLIEHLTKDEIVEFLQACLAALRPGGELWLTTFNAQSPVGSAIFHSDFTHETALTAASMSQVFRATGFADVRVEGSFEPPATLKGALRRGLFGVFHLGWKLRNRVLAGKSIGSAGVDCNSLAPSLFGRARRPVE